MLDTDTSGAGEGCEPGVSSASTDLCSLLSLTFSKSSKLCWGAGCCVGSYWLEAFLRKSSSVWRKVSSRHLRSGLSTLSISPETSGCLMGDVWPPEPPSGPPDLLSTHRWETFWPEFGEDSRQQTGKLELLRDHRRRRSTRPGGCWRTGQVSRRSPSTGGVSALGLLHVRWKSRQTAAHVRQQHVSVLHLVALAAPRRHVAPQHRQT